MFLKVGRTVDTKLSLKKFVKFFREKVYKIFAESAAQKRRVDTER